MKCITVILDNAWASLSGREEDEQLWQALRDFWSFYPKGYKFMPRFKSGQWNGKICLLRRQHIPAGLFRATRKAAEEKCDVHFAVTYNRPASPEIAAGLPAAEPAYAYQDDCVEAMCRVLPKGGGIVLSATATGKTAIAAKFFSRIPLCQCLFVVDQLDLLDQNRTEVEHWLGEPVGKIGDSQFSLGRVTVATIQTLHRHLHDPKFFQWYASLNIVVVDELHEQLNRRNFDVLTHIDPLARYGLTATLQLKHQDVKMRAHAFAGPVIFEFAVKDGMEQGVLAQGRVLQLLFGSISGARNYQDNYREEVLENDLKLESLGSIINYLIHHEKYVIVLADRVDHIWNIAESLEDIPHAVAIGEVEMLQRSAARQRFESGEIRLLIASRVFKKGVNIKRVDVIVDMAEMRSQNDALQKFGRELRLHPDKNGALYIDFGTYDGRFAARASSRARAFKQAGIQFQSYRVDSAHAALQHVKEQVKIWQQIPLLPA